MKGKPHYIEADLNEEWVLAGLIRLELYLEKHARFEEYEKGPRSPEGLGRD